MDGAAEPLRDLDPKVPIALMSAPLTGAPAELLEGYRGLPFLAKPFTFFELNSAATSIGRSRACFARSTAPKTPSDYGVWNSNVNPARPLGRLWGTR
jgi:hypothetical protein